MIVTRSLYSFWSAERCGIEATHGPHQVAQNSTTYTLPFSNPVTSSPLTHFSIDSGGALSPTLSFFAFAASGCLAGAVVASVWPTVTEAADAAMSKAAVNVSLRFGMSNSLNGSRAQS